MKTLLIIASIFVTAHGKQIKLTAADTTYLQQHGTNLVKCSISNGNTDIRNNEAADQIFTLLHK